MLIQIIVEQCGNHIVGRRDGMEIAREMEVYLLHRNHLGITAAGSAALDAETRAQRRLAQCHRHTLADAVQPKRKPHRHRCLADAGLRGGDRRDKNQPALLHLRLVDNRQGQFSYILTVMVEALGVDAGALGYLLDAVHRHAARYFYV